MRDNAAALNSGVATVLMCSNVSGLTASVRFLVLSGNGAVADQVTTSIPHGGTYTIATHGTSAFDENATFVSAVGFQGVINIESTQSAVFCTAAIVDANSDAHGIPLHLVRVNAHPGTVE